MKKIISATEAGRLIGNNASVMIGGFLKCGTPTKVIEEILKNGVSGLTLIANDTCFPDSDRGKLIANKESKRRLSHISEPIPKRESR